MTDKVDLEEFGDAETGKENADTQPEVPIEEMAKSVDSMMNVPMVVSVVLGKTVIPVSQLLKLGRGSVIELDKRVGEPVDLLVNDKVIARGELHKIENSLGVTLTEILKDHAPSS